MSKKLSKEFILLFTLLGFLVQGQTPSAGTSTVSVSPATIRTGGKSTITVQLIDASGNNITAGGATVTFAAPSSGSIGTVTDNNNGTYTATYTSGTTTGLITITPSVGGTAFTNTAVIGIGTILPGAVGGFTQATTYSTTGGLTLGLGLRSKYLIVGGGGGGGNTGGGGGGAGGYIEGVTEFLPGDYAITVGAGGAGSTAANLRGTNGGNSSFIGLTADGGGGAGSFSLTSGLAGGSGGGGSNNGFGGTGISGEGENGGRSYGDGGGGGTVRGGGGGGANTAGAAGSGTGNAGNGGAGISSDITGTSTTYAGGGGGGISSSVSFSAGLGGAGGGGNGSKGTVAANNGTNDLGGGGGGGGAIPGNGGNGGNGGSGVVILQYTDAATATGGTLTSFTGNGTNGTNNVGYQVRRFTTVGNSTFSLTGINYSQLSNTISGVISGTGALNFNSPGTLILTGANTYSGVTNINYGTLQIGNGSTTGTLGTANVVNNSVLSFNRSNALSVSNAIGGSGSLRQIGTGTTTLTGANTYTGITTVTSGTLYVNGNQTSASGDVLVSSGANFGGTGTVGGKIIVESGGELVPGNSPGLLTAANGLRFLSGSTFTWELSANTDVTSNRGTSYDGVNVTGGEVFIETGVSSNLVFTTGVDFTNTFWRTDHQWLVFDNMNPAILNSSVLFDQINISADAGGRILTQQTGLGGARFFWTVVGNDIHLNYESGYPSASTSLIYTDRSEIPVNSGMIANLTIQLKDANQNNLTYSGGTLTFTATSGTVSSIVNNNDGTYSAVYNPGSTPVGTVTITPSINGAAFTNTLQISIVNELSLPSAPNAISTLGNFSTGTGLTFNLGLGAEYLVIGGGGAGGSLGGGGGAGEFIEGSQVVFSGITNSIVVGNGGQLSSNNGMDSRFNAIVAKGGGGGGSIGSAGKSGGSGGGGARSVDGGIDGLGFIGGNSTKSIGFGNIGGQSRGFAGEHLKGGGGGGAGSIGESAPTGYARAGNGGIGKQSSITGTAVFYAAGGGGGAGSSISSAGIGGQGGGGNGGQGATNAGANAIDNTGSGGGGGGSTAGSGAAGGKGATGVVMVRYAGSNDLADGGLESTININGQPYRLHRFNSVGSSSLTFNFSNFDFSSYSAKLPGNISGTGSLTFNSDGRLIVTGNNTYSGTTIISSGTIEVGDGGATGTIGTGQIINNGSLEFNRSNNYTISNNISGSGSLVKKGTGQTLLSGNNTYTGTTTIQNGELRVNSNITTSASVTVASGAVLSGNGTLPATTINGTHSPGNSPGLQSISGHLTYNTGSALSWELASNSTGTRGTDFDGIDVSGNLNFAGTTSLNLIFNATGSAVDWTNAFWSTAKTGSNGWKIFEVTGTITGLNNVTINAATQWIDINNKVLRTQLVSNGTFALEQVGTAVYLTYVPNPLASFAIAGINPVVAINTTISGVQIRAVDVLGNTISAFTGTATLSGTAGITGTTSAFTSGVLTTSIAPTSLGSAKTFIVTSGSVTSTATFDVVNAFLTGNQILDGTSGENQNTNYFSTNGNLTLSQGFFVDYLIVGGGGGGGSFGGGGGAGGVLSNIGGTPLQLNAQDYVVTIGAGGNGSSSAGTRGASGGSSSFASLTAGGGGGGGSRVSGTLVGQSGASGASGGGGSHGNSGSTALGGTANGQGLGFAGGNGKIGQTALSPSGVDHASGGGAGAGGVGGNAVYNNNSFGFGGIGIQNNITGSDVWYAGGGGHTYGGGTAVVAPGGNGGGGAGGFSNSILPTNGTDNKGGGGGGAGGTSGAYLTGGKGGSGVVIVRYEGPELNNVGGTVTTFTGNGIIGKNGSPYQVHTFNSSSNFNLVSIDFNERLGVILSNPIVGTGNLTYNGNGKLIFVTNNTYDGSTNITGGSVHVGNGSTTGNLGSGAITVSSGASLIFNRSNTIALGPSNVLSGTGTVEQMGGGILDLGGINSHAAGTLVLNSGTISNGTISASNFNVTDGTISAVLGGTGSLTKTGSGSVTLNGNNTYTGPSVISAGNLIINGTKSGTGSVTVGNGGTLKGIGTIAGTTTIQSGGTLNAGHEIGTINLSALTLESGGNLNWQINNASGIQGTNWDLINITGALTISSSPTSPFNINVWSIINNGQNGILPNYKPTESFYTWTIITAGSISGFSADKFQINLNPSNGAGGLISPYQINGFKVVQQGNTLVLQYDPPATQTIDGTNNGLEISNYTTSNTTGSLTLNLGLFVDYLVIGGGGGGGSFGGGGGAGGVLSNIGGTPLQLNAQNYVVTIGAGGNGSSSAGTRGASGGSSSFASLTAGGGGGGGSRVSGTLVGQSGANGASGGGGSHGNSGNAASSGIAIGQGIGTAGGKGKNNLLTLAPSTINHASGGGGGAGGSGGNGAYNNNTFGFGGIGIQNNITGSDVWYAGGGGGHTYGGSNAIVAPGGNGGGGAGGFSNSILPTNGTDNKGGGGGGSGGVSGAYLTGGKGGSGVVIIRYEGDALSGVGGTVTTFTGNGTIGKNGVPYRVHTFNSSGNFNLSNVDFNARLKATLTGNIIGNGNLIYDSDGRLTLTGTNHTYTGTTTIQNGELRINSNITSSASVTVASGGVLSGSGTLPVTTIDGTHAPGNSPGVQTVSGDLTYTAGSSIKWELVSNSIGTRGTDYDGIDVTGNLNFAGATTLQLIFNNFESVVNWSNNFWQGTYADANGWLLFDVGGTITGLSNVSLQLSLDKNNQLLSSIWPNISGFGLKQVGSKVYVTYTNGAKWTGATSTDWHATSNWEPAIVPTNTMVAYITSATNQPVSTASIEVKGLTLDSNTTLTIAPTHVLKVIGSIHNNGQILFKSNALGSGMFDEFTGVVTGTGSVQVERYIPAKRAFRFLSSSVTTNTSIQQNWQENGGSVLGLGTHITGAGGATNGFDATATNNPSMFGFNHSTGQWAAVSNTNVNKLTAGTPYRLMVRGDRTVDLTTNNPNATVTVLRATGTLHTGNFTPTLNQTANGFSFVGNPYQAPLDMKAVLINSSTNMNTDVLYYWDPGINARGGYVTRTLSVNQNNVSSPNFTEILQPGQAVFVQKDATSAIPTITILETHKRVSQGAAGVFRGGTNNFGLLRANLQANLEGQWQTIDGALVIFNDTYSWDVTQDDAGKMVNLDEEVSFMQGNTSLTIAKQSYPTQDNELPIRLDKLRHTNYQWMFDVSNYNGLTPYLLDLENNTLREIENGTVVPFTTGGTSLSRFKIVFQNTVLSAPEFKNPISLYPNPGNPESSFYLSGVTAVKVNVHNLLGQSIPVTISENGLLTTVTPVVAISQGVYLVSVTDAENKIVQIKWVVE